MKFTLICESDDSNYYTLAPQTFWERIVLAWYVLCYPSKYKPLIVVQKEFFENNPAYKKLT